MCFCVFFLLFCFNHSYFGFYPQFGIWWKQVHSLQAQRKGNRSVMRHIISVLCDWFVNNDLTLCMQVNTDGLVLRGWYTSLTLAVYGTAERPHGHDHGSPPPPPPPPPQQPTGLKRIVKQGGATKPPTTLIFSSTSWKNLCFCSLRLVFFFCMLNVSVFMFLFLKNGKKMTSITAAHPDQHPEGLVLHLDLHPQMTMRRSKSQWQVRSELLDQFYTCWFKVYKWILLQKFNIKICTLLLSLSFFLHLLQ